MKHAGWLCLLGLLAGCPGSSTSPISPPRGDSSPQDHGTWVNDGQGRADGSPTTDLFVPLDGPPDLLAPVPFGDVPAGHPQYTEIQWVAQQGIMIGCKSSPPTFCPDAPIKRSEVAVTLIRMKHGESFSYSPTPHFSDVPSSHWAFKYVQKLFDDGVTVGCAAGLFCPTNPMLRKHWALFLYRIKTL